MLELTPWIFLLPFLAFPVVLFFGRWLPLKGASVALASVAFGLALSSLLFFSGVTGHLNLPYTWRVPWFEFGLNQVTLGVYIDGTSVCMLFVITLVSFLVQLYSLGYMRGDPRFKRYYAFLSLFTASMLGLVMADNLLVTFACWELVGLCSYFLIGFWFEKPAAAQAGRKAFITTKLGDLGFAIGLFLLFSLAGTFSIPDLKEMVAANALPAASVGLVALLLFCGAMGKSAQIPLFVWLPDAMEGPTPVSALIHAATMVAAGVFLVARVFFLFEVDPFVLKVVAGFGAATAFCAALMGLVPEDIKRVLAFSTVSQLGYMMAGLAVGGPQVGMFHLTTHATFKALLFLGAGSVIHAVHTNNMWEMGGLRKKMPVTFVTFLIGVLALAGIFPLSGFFSKDEILHSALSSGNIPVFVLLTITAGLTAFYMTRALVVTFFGEARDHERYHHAHESPVVMTVPLIVLAALSVVLGAFLFQGHRFAHLIPQKLEHEFYHPTTSFQTLPTSARSGSASGGKVEIPEAELREIRPDFSRDESAEKRWWGHVPTIVVALGSSAVALGGLALAWIMYGARLINYEALYQKFSILWKFLYYRMGFDHFWLALVGLSYRFSRLLAIFDYQVIDQGIVDGFGWATDLMSKIGGWFDRVVVDNLVDFWGWFSLRTGNAVRLSVSGIVQNYLLYVIIGVSLILAFRLYF